MYSNNLLQGVNTCVRILLEREKGGHLSVCLYGKALTYKSMAIIKSATARMIGFAFFSSSPTSIIILFPSRPGAAGLFNPPVYDGSFTKSISSQ